MRHRSPTEVLNVLILQRVVGTHLRSVVGQIGWNITLVLVGGHGTLGTSIPALPSRLPTLGWFQDVLVS